MNNNCIFCKIVNKEIPASINYEDDNFIGFLDIKPIEKGHTLLIPKKHYPWMQDLPDDELAKIFTISKKIMLGMVKDLSCNYVEVKVVGKDVPHFHIHLIPRNK